jgi:hypothetical protein
MVQSDSIIIEFPTRDFHVGSVFSKSISILFRHVVSFNIVSLLVMAPFLFLAGLMGLAMSVETDSGETLMQSLMQSHRLSAIITFGPLASLIWVIIFFPMSFGFILHIAFQDMRGRPAKLSEGLKRGFARILPVIAVLFLCLMTTLTLSMIAAAVANAFAVSSGSPLFIVLAVLALAALGAMLGLRWFVALPVCVVERAGPFRSLGRSAALTAGHRWKILAILGLALLLDIMALSLPELLLARFPISRLISSAFIELLLWTYLMVLMVVAYHDLRIAREGVDIEGIASVFD